MFSRLDGWPKLGRLSRFLTARRLIEGSAYDPSGQEHLKHLTQLVRDRHLFRASGPLNTPAYASHKDPNRTRYPDAV
jgi:hypothetical protein